MTRAAVRVSATSHGHHHIFRSTCTKFNFNNRRSSLDLGVGGSGFLTPVRRFEGYDVR